VIDNISITRFVKDGGPLTKAISFDPAGHVKNDSSACLMSAGRAYRVDLQSVAEFGEVIVRMAPNEAIALGSLRLGINDGARVVCKNKLNGHARPDTIARTGDFIIYEPGRAAPVLLDFDRKGMPAEVERRVTEAGGLWGALTAILPSLNGAARVERNSTSAGLFDERTGESLRGSGGVHIYILIRDGTDSERFLKTLHERCWLAGGGWAMVGAGGQLLERSIIDRMVGAPERLVFEADPILIRPVAQDKACRHPTVTEGNIVDTVSTCPPLTSVEQSKLRELRAREAQRLAPERAKSREAFIKRQSEHLVSRTGMDPRRARKTVERQCEGVLLPDVVLEFDDAELEGKTVADVLADPARYEGETLADPLEGIEYGRCKAMIMRREDGTPWIHSFAHGSAAYELKLDFNTAKAALEKTAREEAVETLVRLVRDADLAADEVEDLRNLTSERSGITKPTIDRKLKADRQATKARQAQQHRERRVAERRDPRPQLPVPSADAEWLPVMQDINEVLGQSRAAEPPTRNPNKIVALVRSRHVPSLHHLTSREANE
jgi:hypothetical protein